jgi:hypothetical protein
LFFLLIKQPGSLVKGEPGCNLYNIGKIIEPAGGTRIKMQAKRGLEEIQIICHPERSEGSTIELFNCRIDPSFLRMTKEKEIPLSSEAEERVTKHSGGRVSQLRHSTTTQSIIFKLTIPLQTRVYFVATYYRNPITHEKNFINPPCFWCYILYCL